MFYVYFIKSEKHNETYIGSTGDLRRRLFEHNKGKEESTPREMEEITKIPHSTVNQVLQKLLSLKMIERIGLGRSIRYKKPQ